jgi:enoyl-CoA hydratase/carnithine racemase
MAEQTSATAEPATSPDDDLVRLEVDGSVAVITWNLPERNNAWSWPLERAYFARLRDAADDPSVRVIVVTGAGKHFCPGTDVANLQMAADGDHSADPELREPQTFPMAIPKPIIAAIHGACAGTGFIQAAVSDIRFADQDARFTPAFARRGIMAEHGLSVLLPGLVGLTNALDVLLSARTMSAKEMYGIGFVTHLSKPGSALADAVAYAKDMAANCSPMAMAVTKRQVYEAFGGQLESARLEAIALWRVLRTQPDFTEGVASYLETRAPNFAGLKTADVLRTISEVDSSS